MDDYDQMRDQLQEKINSNIEAALGEVAGSLVLRWVACVEVYEKDGDRGLWTFTSDNAKRWDIFGLLKELEMYQQANMIAHIIMDHE